MSHQGEALGELHDALEDVLSRRFEQLLEDAADLEEPEPVALDDLARTAMGALEYVGRPASGVFLFTLAEIAGDGASMSGLQPDVEYGAAPRGTGDNAPLQESVSEPGAGITGSGTGVSSPDAAAIAAWPPQVHVQAVDAEQLELLELLIDELAYEPLTKNLLDTIRRRATGFGQPPARIVDLDVEHLRGALTQVETLMNGRLQNPDKRTRT